MQAPPPPSPARVCMHRFGLKHGYRLCPFWSGIGYGFEGTTGLYENYFTLQFQTKKERKSNMPIQMDLRKSSCWPSNLINDISAFAKFQNGNSF